MRFILTASAIETAPGPCDSGSSEERDAVRRQGPRGRASVHMVVMCLGFGWMSVGWTIAEDHFSCHIESLDERVLDVAETRQLDDRSYIPSHRYLPTIAPSGAIGIIRHVNPSDVLSKSFDKRGYRELIRGILTREDVVYSVVSVLHLGSEEDADWEPVRLSGAGPYHLFDAPRILFGPQEVPYILWIQRDIEQDRWSSVLRAQRWPHQGGEETAIVVSNDKGSTVLSFSGLNANDGAIELVWTEDSGKHESWKVFARSLYADGLGPTRRVSPRRGAYDAEPATVATDARGNLFALWDSFRNDDGGQLFLAVGADGKWNRPFKISDEHPLLVTDADFESGGYEIPTLHVDFAIASPGQDKAVVVWKGSGGTTGILSRSFADGQLGAIEKVANEGVGVQAVGVSTGSVLTIYQKEVFKEATGQDASTSPQQESKIYYRCWQAAGWSEESVLTDSALMSTPRVHIDDQHRIHFFWQEIRKGAAHLIHRIGRLHSLQ